PNGSEEANERRDRSDRGQPVHIHLQLCDLLADTQLQTAFDGHLVDQSSALLDLPLDFTVAEIEDCNQRRGIELFARYGDRLQAVRLSERAQKSAVGAARPTEHAPFRKHDGPGKQQKGQYPCVLSLTSYSL